MLNYLQRFVVVLHLYVILDIFDKILTSPPRIDIVPQGVNTLRAANDHKQTLLHEAGDDSLQHLSNPIDKPCT